MGVCYDQFPMCLRENAELAPTGSFVLLLRHRQMALATKLMAVPMAPVDYPGITSRDSSRGWTHHWPELGGHVGGRRLKITGFQGAGALGLAESLLG